MIRFEQVSKKYEDGTAAVKLLNLEIRDGEFFVLIGPSGCGKTTTLKMINRLIGLTEGTVWINDKKISEYNIHELRWNIGYVLQHISLFPHMTVAENIAVVPELKKWSKAKTAARVDELLHMVGLDPSQYRDRKPKELSGGQQQRVGVLRALAADPEILLMDEPFSALDPFSREKLQDDLLEIQRKIKKTIVFVTHDMQEAMKLGDRICLMKGGEVVQVDTPYELLAHPANDFVRQFVGSSGPVMKLEELMTPVEPDETDLQGVETVSLDTPIYEVLERIGSMDRMYIEQNGDVVGMISRQTVLLQLAQQLREKGQLYG